MSNVAHCWSDIAGLPTQLSRASKGVPKCCTSRLVLHAINVYMYVGEKKNERRKKRGETIHCQQEIRRYGSGGSILRNTCHSTSMGLELLLAVSLVAACHHTTGLAIIAITGLAQTLQAVVAAPLFFLPLVSVAMVAIPRSGINSISTGLEHLKHFGSTNYIGTFDKKEKYWCSWMPLLLALRLAAVRRTKHSLGLDAHRKTLHNL